MFHLYVVFAAKQPDPEAGDGGGETPRIQPDHLPRLPQLPLPCKPGTPRRCVTRKVGSERLAGGALRLCLPPRVQLFCFQVQHKLCLAVGGGKGQEEGTDLQGFCKAIGFWCALQPLSGNRHGG